MMSSSASKVYPVRESSPRDSLDAFDEAGDGEHGVKQWSQSLSRVRELIATNRCAVILVFIAAITSIATILIVVIALITGCYITRTDVVQPIFVYMIWRHGDRAPIINLEALPVDLSEFPNGTGTLTKLGFTQSIDLGERIKRRYFGHKNLSTQNVFIRSTNISRTIMTAEGVIRGLQIPELGVVVDLPMEKDTVGNPLFQCPLASEIVAKWGDEYMLRANYSDVYETLMREANYSGNTYQIMDLIDCMEAHNLKLPQWAKNATLKEAMRNMSWTGLEMQYGIGRFHNDTLMKIRSGSIFRGLIEQLYAKLQRINDKTTLGNNNTEDLYFYGISAHDITIGAILVTFSHLNAIIGNIPYIQYGANLAFELYDIKGKYKIKILYANKFDEEPKIITHYAGGCENSSTLCDVNKFIKHSKQLFFEDVEKHCKESATSKSRHGKVKRSADFFNGNLAELFIT
uniref:acid phosphatase n=2 Tax=Parascaris univalens TaxID=6257 RepID=A0A915B0C0_PARUN